MGIQILHISSGSFVKEKLFRYLVKWQRRLYSNFRGHGYHNRGERLDLSLIDQRNMKIYSQRVERGDQRMKNY